jgi:hypothetical protein
MMDVGLLVVLLVLVPAALGMGMHVAMNVAQVGPWLTSRSASQWAGICLCAAVAAALTYVLAMSGVLEGPP